MKISKSEIFSYLMATNIWFLILLSGVEKMALVVLIYVLIVNIVGIIWGIKKRIKERK